MARLKDWLGVVPLAALSRYSNTSCSIRCTTIQTPEPISLDEHGKDWKAVVEVRLALLDERPAIREKFHAVTGDAIQMNGLPTSAVTDMGNHYALRAQRVVFQEWKEDVPWAKKGEVTVALGGDIAKERGLFPPEALDPAIVYVHPVDKFSIRVPSRWKRQEGTSVSRVILAGPIEGKGASPSVTVHAEPKPSGQASRDLFPERPMRGYQVLSEEQTTLNGHPSVHRVFVLGSVAEAEMRAIEVTLTHGEVVYTLDAAVARERFDRHAATFEWMIASFTLP